MVMADDIQAASGVSTAAGSCLPDAEPRRRRRGGRKEHDVKQYFLAFGEVRGGTRRRAQRCIFDRNHEILDSKNINLIKHLLDCEAADGEAKDKARVRESAQHKHA